MPLPNDIEDLAAWLRLSMEPGAKPAVLRALLAAGGLPTQIYRRNAADLARLAPARLAAQLAAPPAPPLQAAVDAALAWAASPGPHHILTLADADYPRRLLDIPDPPLLLYVCGDPSALSRPMLAIVGARNATAGGLANARAFARHLAEAGWCIASGLARGIDAAAHDGALSAGTAGAGTVAVLGTGIDRVYPRGHEDLARRVAAHGALVSELPPGALPLPHHFPQRNRLVAGLALGVLVVEAADRSGSLSTARMAADTGREVFAIPGSIHSPLSRGCHALIRQGARLVETARDIDDELRPPHIGPSGCARQAAGSVARSDDASDAPLPPDGPARTLWLALGYDPVHLDELQRRTQLDGAAVQAGLLELELSGWAERLDGSRYQRLKR